MNSEIEFRDENPYTCEHRPDNTFMITMGEEEASRKREEGSFTAYKRVDKKVKPVPGIFPEDARVIRQFPEDPLHTLTSLPTHPPDFVPSE